MKILVLSDMHFDISESSNDRNDAALEIASIAKNNIENNEKLLVLNLGDVVNCGNSICYDKAREFYDYLKLNLPSNTDYAFVPGNHDYCGDKKLICFDEFIKAYSTVFCNYDYKSTFVLKYDEISFILSKSTLDRYKEGNKYIEIVDIDEKGITEAIELEDKLVNPVLVMHHGLLSKNGTDFIKGQDIIIKLNKKYSFQCYIHGHEHSEEKEYLRQPLGIKSISVGNCFRLPKATIPQFSILDVNCGIITERKIYERKYEKYEFSNKEKVQNVKYSKKYSVDDDYIMRNVMSLDDYGEKFRFARYEIPIQDVIEDNKTVIILGEAGAGKSYFTKNYVAKKQECNCRIELVYCRNYSGEKIINLLSKELINNLDDFTIFFDGLDEVKEKYLSILINEITEFCSIYKSKVIITSRLSEFKKINQENKGLSEIPQFVLSDFKYDDTVKYLKLKEIDTEKFMKEVLDKSLYPLHLKPFYLYHLARYYLEYKCLPKQDEFFYEMIDKETEKIISRQLTKGQILGKNEIKKSLYVLGFTMLCSGLKSLSIEQSNQILDSLNFIHITDNDIVNVTDDSVSFCHNNFKEYCAAQFLLEFDYNEVLNLITINGKKIKSSWVNAVGFYILNKIRNKKIINHIMLNDLSAVTNIEPDKLNVKDIREIYNSVLNESIKTGVRIENLVHNEKLFSGFVNDEADLLNLLSYIENSNDTVAIIDAFVLLSNKENLFGKEEKLYNSTLDFFERYMADADYKDYVVGEGITMIADLHLCNSDEKIMQILNMFKRTKSDRILHDVYRLILSVDSGFKYTDYLLDIEMNKCVDQHISAGSEFCLYQYFMKIDEYSSVKKFLCVYANSQFCLYDKEKVLKHFLDIIKEKHLYIEDSKETLFNLFIEPKYIHHSTTSNYLASYFKEVELTKEFLDFLINNKGPHYIFVLQGLLDAETEKYFCKLYEDDMLPCKYDFINYVRNMNSADENYNEFVRIIQNKGDGDELINYYEIQEMHRTNAEKKHFNLMFSFDEYITEFKLLFNDFIEQGLTMKQFFDDYIIHKMGSKELTEEYFTRQAFYYDMNAYLSDKDLLSEYIDLVHLSDVKYINRMYHIANEKHIHETKAQINFFEKYCKTYIENHFNEDIALLKDNSVTWRLSLFAELTYKYNFIYGYKHLKSLLLIPSYVFNGNDMGALSPYIINNYDQLQIANCISELIFDKNLNVASLVEFVNYFAEKRMDIGEPIASEYLVNKSINQYDREILLKYLLDIKVNEKWIDSLNFDDDIELLEIVFRNAKEKHNNIIDAYKNLNLKDEQHIKGLSELLQLNESYGIKAYISYCKTNMQVPDFKGADSYPSITDKIACINSVDYLEELGELLILCSSKEFKDIRHFGLYNSLSKAFVNTSRSNYQDAVDMLESLSLTDSENKLLIQNCNYIKLDIQRESDNGNESIYDLEDIVSLILN